MPAETRFGEDVANIYWEKAYLAVGVSCLRSISSAATLLWQQNAIGHFSPGIKTGSLPGDGFHVDIAMGKEFEKPMIFR